jgi:protein-tyrosine phosphatase
MVALLEVVINKYREEAQDIVLICHSMGCSLGALLSSKTSPYASQLSSSIRCLVTICPPHKSYKPDQVNQTLWALSVPDVIFNLWRAWDRRGGLESGSVRRFTGSGADEQLKRLQVRFNNQSRTPVFRRMAYGAFSTADKPQVGAISAGKDIWAGISTPVLLIAAKDDPVTPSDEAIAIAQYLGHSGIPDDHHANGAFHASQNGVSPEAQGHSRGDVKLVVFPSPASHAILYSQLTVRPISCLIQHFLSSNVSEHLSLGWQLTYLSTEGKWDVKKWSEVEPVGAPVASIFRAMKTLREVDSEHNPRDFVKTWGSRKDGIGAVVDISHDPPVYDERGLEDGGIIYCKCPTVSKLPPTKDEVETFIYAVDHIRHKLEKRDQPSQLIGVHCHYGFNRTGFFIVSYLVERMGYPLSAALEEFKTSRPPGIRHSHFTDELYGRYFDYVDVRHELTEDHDS